MKKIYFALLFSILFAETEITNHNLEIHLNPQTHEIVATDEMTISSDGMAEFFLSKKLTIAKVEINGKSARVSEMNFFDEPDWVQKKFKKYRVRPPLYRRVFGKKSTKNTVKIQYSGVLFQDTENSSFSREKVAMEIDATISEEGIFLSPSAGFYPLADEEFTAFLTEIYLPSGWDAVSEGKLTLSEKDENGSKIGYKTEYPLDAIHITAAQWIVEKQTVGDVEFFAYFFPEDSSLIEQYLGASIGYVQSYSEMLSPYPYSKFAVVENFFPTGYGMPSYTVLGRSVIRLPFIVFTSLGHEVLHNWWGNSVFVGSGGNWCEGLTSYQADYFYKLQKSESAAKQYRKDLLKDYAVYATGGNDFAPSEFTSRSDMSTRAIGYGKVAMIFYMMEQHLGAEKFNQALRQTIEKMQWKNASYNDFFAEFESVSGEDFSEFLQKWVNEAGNPKLELTEENGDFFVVQSGAIKPMWIPVFSTNENSETTEKIVFSNTEKTALDIEKSGLSRLAIDPNFSVMRTLDESEIDPTLRNILNQKSFSFVVPSLSEDWKNLAKSFASSVNSDAEFETVLDDNLANFGAKIYLGVLPKNQKIDACEIITENNGLVWAFRQDTDAPGLVVYSENIEQLSPLVRKLPHYGKYGYLIFENGKNIAKGNHEVTDSPLIWRN
ncbi:MAG: hypothetical protein ISS00_04000 [Candidatus Marinimicrobia bacterium]|nr:hypothetical protein [Candidatus Neomarinimicrobiota bacterium]